MFFCYYPSLLIRTLIAFEAGAEANVNVIAPLAPLTTSALTVAPVETSTSCAIKLSLLVLMPCVDSANVIDVAEPSPIVPT